jgi:hypothetical protein
MKLEEVKIHARRVAGEQVVGTPSPQVRRARGNGAVVIDAKRVRNLLDSMTPEAAGENTAGMASPYSDTRVYLPDIELGQIWTGKGKQMGMTAKTGEQLAVPGGIIGRNTTQVRHMAAQTSMGRNGENRKGGRENGTPERPQTGNLREMARRAWVAIEEQEEAGMAREAALRLGYDEDIARECVWNDVADELNGNDMKGIREASRVRRETARCQMLLAHGGKRRMVEKFSGQGRPMAFMLRLIKDEIGVVEV